ncbi:ubiquitin-conjugating enzyme [Candidatus Methanoplasma termitum]|uniref:Ubiquitin-conjugating enzyme n=1 Tax=Candidatus Methanoplasma termitum TaxID=1577791 RepID=A0A0A7LA35_9ARCH|nr:ubiquitin-conjugating enzyme E2 [Candidatus Methanoplasma termitum]AIZ55944.1 ubiquitin-conjugating enzyme [Candidatus Methanoplasma termitum]MCL2334262.1 ubiquitin-conjugating enzyme E2 [Candidatus Methanoplasma sp.]
MGLVRQVLIKRINNEILGLKSHLNVRIKEVPDDVEFPIEIRIALKNIPARISKDQVSGEHILSIIVTENYPYERPRAKWMTPIFHPNIMMPEDGGYVCVKMLDDWSFGSSLLSFVRGVEQLISEPNPKNPFGTDSCLEAAKWYSANKPRIEAEVNYGGRNA